VSCVKIGTLEKNAGVPAAAAVTWQVKALAIRLRRGVREAVTDPRRLAAYRREPRTGQFTPMPDRAVGDPGPAEANKLQVNPVRLGLARGGELPGLRCWIVGRRHHHQARPAKPSRRNAVVASSTGQSVSTWWPSMSLASSDQGGQGPVPAPLVRPRLGSTPLPRPSPCTASDKLLRTLLCRASRSDEIPGDLSAIDAGGEMHKLLARVAAESKEGTWSSELARVIGEARVGSARSGIVEDLGEAAQWPTSNHQVRDALLGLLTLGTISRKVNALADALAQLATTSQDKHQARQALLGLLARQAFSWETDLSAGTLPGTAGGHHRAPNGSPAHAGTQRWTTG